MIGRTGNPASPEIMPTACATRSQKKAIAALTVTVVDTSATWAISTSAANGTTGSFDLSFDPAAYIGANRDLAGLSAEDATSHFIGFGKEF